MKEVCKQSTSIWAADILVTLIVQISLSEVPLIRRTNLKDIDTDR